MDLFVSSQKVDLADLLEVHPDRVAREHDRRGISSAVAAAGRTLLRGLALRGSGAQRGIDFLCLACAGFVLILVEAIFEIVLVAVRIEVVVHAVHRASVDIRHCRIVARDIYALGAQHVIEIRQFFGIDINITGCDLDIILRYRSVILGRFRHKGIDGLHQFGGQLDILFRLLCSHVFPFDAQSLLLYPLLSVCRRRKSA